MPLKKRVCQSRFLEKASGEVCAQDTCGPGNQVFLLFGALAFPSSALLIPRTHTSLPVLPPPSIALPHPTPLLTPLKCTFVLCWPREPPHRKGSPRPTALGKGHQGPSTNRGGMRGSHSWPQHTLPALCSTHMAASTPHVALHTPSFPYLYRKHFLSIKLLGKLFWGD